MKQQRTFTHMASPDEIQHGTLGLDNHHLSSWQLIDRLI